MAPVGSTFLFQECVHWLQNTLFSNGISTFCIKSLKKHKVLKTYSLLRTAFHVCVFMDCQKHQFLSCIINVLHQNVNITQVSLMFSWLWNTRLHFVVFKWFLMPLSPNASLCLFPPMVPYAFFPNGSLCLCPQWFFVLLSPNGSSCICPSMVRHAFGP